MAKLSQRLREKKLKEKETRNQSKQRKKILWWTALSSVALAAIGGLFFLFSGQQQTLHDLGDVGQGIPAVVQVHDKNCPICIELRQNVSAIEGEFASDELLIRIADIDTTQGLAFASRHTSERWRTLLYIDGNGRLVDVQTGLRTSEELKETFKLHAEGLLGLASSN